MPYDYSHAWESKHKKKIEHQASVLALSDKDVIILDPRIWDWKKPPLFTPMDDKHDDHDSKKHKDDKHSADKLVNFRHNDDDLGHEPNAWSSMSAMEQQGCIFHSLFEPTGQLADVLKHMDPIPRVGVHVRTGDAYILKGGGESSDRRAIITNKQWGLNSPRHAAQQLVHCAQEIAMQLGWDQVNPGQPKKQNSPTCDIVFESDSEEARLTENFKKDFYSYPCRVISSQQRVMNKRADNKGVTATDMLNAWAALLKLSMTDVLISSESGFSDMAASFGPAMADRVRFLKIEDVLFRRIKAGGTINDKKGMCNFTRLGAKYRRGFIRLLKGNGTSDDSHHESDHDSHH
jgi:hypothetical protein